MNFPNFLQHGDNVQRGISKEMMKGSSSINSFSKSSPDSEREVHFCGIENLVDKGPIFLSFFYHIP